MVQPDGSKKSYATAISRFGGGLVYLLPRFSNPFAPLFDLHVGLMHYGFTVEKNPNLQDIALTNLVAGGRVTLPFRKYLQLGVKGDYRVLLRARSTAFDPFMVSPGSLQGFSVEGSLLGRVIKGLGYKASFTFERYIGELQSLATEDVLDVRDRFMSAIAALTYEL